MIPESLLIRHENRRRIHSRPERDRQRLMHMGTRRRAIAPIDAPAWRNVSLWQITVFRGLRQCAKLLEAPRHRPDTIDRGDVCAPQTIALTKGRAECRPKTRLCLKRLQRFLSR